MKEWLQMAFSVLSVAAMTGCASTGGYFVDRGRDAADVFNCTLGYGAGAKVRVGLLQVPPLLVNRDVVGLYGGKFFCLGTMGIRPTYPYVNEISSFFPVLAHGTGSFEMPPFPYSSHADRRKQPESAGVYCLICYDEVPKWFDIEVAGGCLVTARLTFNPAELLDFILGWTGVDIFADDIEARGIKGKPNEASQTIGAGAPQHERWLEKS